MPLFALLKSATDTALERGNATAGRRLASVLERNAARLRRVFGHARNYVDPATLQRPETLAKPEAEAPAPSAPAPEPVYTRGQYAVTDQYGNIVHRIVPAIDAGRRIHPPACNLGYGCVCTIGSQDG